jgi:hypothetical protein
MFQEHFAFKAWVDFSKILTQIYMQSNWDLNELNINSHFKSFQKSFIKILSWSKMKKFEIVSIVMTFTLLYFKYAVNIKTLVYSNKIIVSKTIFNTKASKHFTQTINTNCFFKFDRITRIVFSVISITSIIII